MKKFLLAALAVSFLACEPECDDCEECDTDTEIGEDLPPVQRAIVQAAWSGSVVTMIGEDDSELVEIQGVVGLEFAYVWEVMGVPEFELEMYGVITVRELRNALATCPALGLPSPTYDWFCVMDGSKGRALASGTPDIESFTIFEQAGSEENPGDLTGRVFYSSTWYPLQADTSANPAALFGLITAWGAGWNDAALARCASPVFAPFCAE